MWARKTLPGTRRATSSSPRTPPPRRPTRPSGRAPCEGRTGPRSTRTRWRRGSGSRNGRRPGSAGPPGLRPACAGDPRRAHEEQEAGRAAGVRFPAVPQDTLRPFERDRVTSDLDKVTAEGWLVFHSLRHGSVSCLIDSDAKPKGVQSLARHGTAAFTFNRYSHARRGKAQVAVERAIPDMINGPAAAEKPADDPETGPTRRSTRSAKRSTMRRPLSHSKGCERRRTFQRPQPKRGAKAGVTERRRKRAMGVEPTTASLEG